MEVQAATDADLVVGARYIAASGLGGEPIGTLLPVGNRGGIRFGGRLAAPHYVSLFSTFSEPDWPDSFEDGDLLYWGDNRSAGNDLHATPKRGNLLFRNIFQMAWVAETRWRIPLISLFSHHSGTRDVDLLGILVPGGESGPEATDLIAIWRRNSDGWFQNYRASFRALPVQSLSRRVIAAWPTMDRAERVRSLPGFAEWLDL